MKKTIVRKFGRGKTKFVLVCCLHGDEPFGRKVFDYFEKYSDSYGTFKLILANQIALSKKVRFIDADLNRCFPGSRSGNFEQKIAYNLIKKIPKTAYIFDIHTTITNIKFAPIITSYNKHTQKILNLIDAECVIQVKEVLSGKSLIGQFDRGVSLEINRHYAKKDEALSAVAQIISDLFSGRQKLKRYRKIFQVDGVIDKKIKLPKKVDNFKKIRGLGVYPILYHKNSYPDIHALSATTYRRAKI